MRGRLFFYDTKREAARLLTVETTTSVNGINTDVDHEPCSVNNAILRGSVVLDGCRVLLRRHEGRAVPSVFRKQT